MNPYDQRGTGQPQGRAQPTGSAEPEVPPPGSGYPQGAQQRGPVSEMAVETPTLRWVSIGHPAEDVPIGPDDYVLDSVYNPGTDAWEVLVIVQPGDDGDGDEDE